MRENNSSGNNLKEEGKSQLKRGIGSRQLSMIAIGGAIGTGLFLASGKVISQAGPGGALLAFGIMGILVYFMMMSLGAMATQLPIPGGFQGFASRFVDPALGVAFGWNYWFAYAITLAAELVAGAIIMKYWFPNVDGSLWAAIFFVFLMGLNLMSSKAFAEAEFWFASIKVVAIVVFLFVGVLMVVGVFNSVDAGFQNWTLKGTGEHAGENAPFVGGMGAMIGVFLVAGFSFQGTEGVGIAAAEAENPETTVPKAIRTVFWRILLFYIGAMFIIGTLIPFTDPSLLGGTESDITLSPFVIVFKQAGIQSAAGIMNAVILTSVLSCGNSSLYVSSRMLYAMAVRGQAPKIFKIVNKRGVPIWSVWATGLIGALACLIKLVGQERIYDIFINLSGQTGFVIWFGIALAHYRFRKAWVAQGHSLQELKFRSKFYPVAPICAMILSLIVIFGANYEVFTAETFSIADLIIFYGFIPIFLAIYIGFKVVKKTKVVPLKEANFQMPKEGEDDLAI